MHGIFLTCFLAIKLVADLCAKQVAVPRFFLIDSYPKLEFPYPSLFGFCLHGFTILIGIAYTVLIFKHLRFFLLFSDYFLFPDLF